VAGRWCYIALSVDINIWRNVLPTSWGLKSSGGYECVKLGRLQGGTVVGGREMEFSLGHHQWCTGNVRIQNSFFNDYKDRVDIEKWDRLWLEGGPRRKWDSSPWSGEEAAQAVYGDTVSPSRLPGHHPDFLE